MRKPLKWSSNTWELLEGHLANERHIPTHLAFRTRLLELVLVRHLLKAQSNARLDVHLLIVVPSFEITYLLTQAKRDLSLKPKHALKIDER